jgi:hypothetical protein
LRGVEQLTMAAACIPKDFLVAGGSSVYGRPIQIFYGIVRAQVLGAASRSAQWFSVQRSDFAACQIPQAFKAGGPHGKS